MKAKEVSKYIENIAPKELAFKGDDIGFIIGNPNKEVKKIGIAVRPTVNILKRAKKENIDMIIIHEKLFYTQEKALFEDLSLFMKIPNQLRISEISEGKIILYRAHTNWDDAPGGNNDTLAKKIGIDVITKIPYGRVGTIVPTTLEKFAQHVKRALHCDYVVVVGDLDRQIAKVAVVSGSGNSLKSVIEKAYELNVDVYISGDIKDSTARYATELNLAIIDAGHYSTETPGMKALCEKLKSKFRELDVIFLDISKPWKFI